MTNETEIPPAYLTSDVCDRLQQHLGGVFNTHLVALLDAAADINEDLWRNKAPQFVVDGIARARQALSEIEKGL